MLEVIGDVQSAAGFDKWVKALGHQNGRAIRGIYGEAVATKRAAAAHGKQVADAKLGDIIETGTYKGKQGVDAQFGDELIVEAKAWNSNPYSTVAKAQAGLAKQLEKHIETRIIPLIDRSTGEFQGGVVPLIHYEVGGNVFNPTFVNNLNEAFKKVVTEGKFKKQLEKAGFKFSEHFSMNVFNLEI